MSADKRFAAVNPTAGTDHVGKDARRAEKNIVVAGHFGVNRHVALHFDHCPILQRAKLVPFVRFCNF